MTIVLNTKADFVREQIPLLKVCLLNGNLDDQEAALLRYADIPSEALAFLKDGRVSSDEQQRKRVLLHSLSQKYGPESSLYRDYSTILEAASRDSLNYRLEDVGWNLSVKIYRHPDGFVDPKQTWDAFRDKFAKHFEMNRVGSNTFLAVLGSTIESKCDQRYKGDPQGKLHCKSGTANKLPLREILGARYIVGLNNSMLGVTQSSAKDERPGVLRGAYEVYRLDARENSEGMVVGEFDIDGVRLPSVRDEFAHSLLLSIQNEVQIDTQHY